MGPFANLRTGTCLGPAVKAGAFVEMKETQVDVYKRQFTFIVFRGTWADIVCCLGIRGGVRPLRSGLTNRFMWA